MTYPVEKRPGKSDSRGVGPVLIWAKERGLGENVRICCLVLEVT